MKGNRDVVSRKSTGRRGIKMYTMLFKRKLWARKAISLRNE